MGGLSLSLRSLAGTTCSYAHTAGRALTHHCCFAAPVTDSVSMCGVALTTVVAGGGGVCVCALSPQFNMMDNNTERVGENHFLVPAKTEVEGDS